MKYFRILFFLLLTGLIISATIAGRNSFLLKNKHAKWGILSFQFALNDSVQSSILQQWDKDSITRINYKKTPEPLTTDGLMVAKHQTKVDNVMIAFYIALLCLLTYHYRQVIKLEKKPLNWVWISIMVLLAGICDYVENSYTLGVLNAFPGSLISGSAIIISLLAFLKFLLLILVAFVLVPAAKVIARISKLFKGAPAFLKDVVGLAWKFRIILIALLVLFLCLSFSDQGQDLLVTINTDKIAVVLFYVIVSILAVLCWFLPKLYELLRPVYFKSLYTKPLPEARETSKLDFARFLGIIAYVIPANGILMTLRAYHVVYLLDDLPPIIIMVAVLVIYYYMITRKWLDQFYIINGEFSKLRYTLTIAIILIAIAAFGLLSNNSKHTYYLAYLSLGFYLLSFAFLLTMTYRKVIPPFQKILIFPIIFWTVIIAIVFFVAFNFEWIIYYLTADQRFFSLPIVITGLITHVALFSFLLILGRNTGYKIITILLVCTFIKSAYTISDFHKIHLEPKEETSLKTGDGIAPASLRMYARAWLLSRKAEIARYNAAKGCPYPIYFVNAYGGGIRAAAWPALVIGKLDVEMRGLQKSDTSYRDFQHYIFSYSGSSGGTVGLSMVAASRMAATGSTPKPDTSFLPRNTKNIFKNDYLTANLVGIFGRDMLASSFGLSCYADRARLQELSFEHHLSKSSLFTYNIPLDSGWKSSNTEVPLFVSNTFDINTGRKAIIAPVVLQQDDFPGVVLFQELMEKEPEKGILLSTAALLSARFPFVSPTGKLSEDHHFSDSGTIENSGAETSLQLLRVLEDELKSLAAVDPTWISLQTQFVFISLKNTIKNTETGGQVKNLYEIVAPAIGLLTTIDGNATKADAINEALARKNGWKYFDVRPVLIGVSGSFPVLPLGWQISDDALKQMEESVCNPLCNIKQVVSYMKGKEVPSSIP